MSDIIDIVIQETIDLVDITVTPNIIEVNVTRTSGGGAGIPTLQEVLDNNHDLVDGNFFAGTPSFPFLPSGTDVIAIGTDSGTFSEGNRCVLLGLEVATSNSGNNVNALGRASCANNLGNDINALGEESCFNNSGNSINAFGGGAARANSADNINALGYLAGDNNTFDNVNLFGQSATADENGQTVLSKDGTIMARISTTELTESRKYTLQDADGTLAFLSDITGATPTLQEVITNGRLFTENVDDRTNDLKVFNNDEFDNIFLVKSIDNVTGASQLIEVKNDNCIVQWSDGDKTSGLYLFASHAILQTVNSLGKAVNLVVPYKEDTGTSGITNFYLNKDKEAGFYTIATLDDIPAAGVPYTGATQDVNLGEFGLLTGNIEFDNTPTNIPTTAGSMVWNDTDGTVDLKLKGGNVTLQIGQENVLRVVNKTATNINLLEANYQAVRVTGAQGQRLKVDLAQATTDALSAETIGLVTETINNNQEGFITTGGLIRNVNTTGSLQSETWADGDILYLSPTVAGQITKVKPTAPNHLVIVGYVVHAHATQGSIFVKVDNGYELNELHNVKITSETNNQLLAYTSATDIWENKNLIDILERFNRTQGIYFFEEFMGSQAGGITTNFTGLITTQTGTGANCITTGTITNRTNQQGVIRTQTGTTATGQAGFLYGGVNLFRGTGTISIETYVTVETLSTSTERFFTIFGNIGVANYLNPANGIFFTYDEGGVIGAGANAGSPNFKCVSINTLSRTFFTSSVPVVAGQWYKLRIDINAAGTQAAFYIDGNLITTLTTNIPATSTAMGVHSVIVKTVGTTARATQTDYFMYEEIFTNPR